MGEGHLLPLLAFLHIIILNQTCHQKSTLCYIAVVVSLININLKIILTIIFVVDDVKNIFLMKISHYLLTVSV